jgi:hypothetical protein
LLDIAKKSLNIDNISLDIDKKWLDKEKKIAHQILLRNESHDSSDVLGECRLFREGLPVN